MITNLAVHLQICIFILYSKGTSTMTFSNTSSKIQVDRIVSPTCDVILLTRRPFLNHVSSSSLHWAENLHFSHRYPPAPVWGPCPKFVFFFIIFRKKKDFVFKFIAFYPPKMILIKTHLGYKEVKPTLKKKIFVLFEKKLSVLRRIMKKSLQFFKIMWRWTVNLIPIAMIVSRMQN